MNFDFTPDPKVLLALTQTMMRPIDALCELIDNAIDSFEHAKIEGCPTEQPLIVVELPQKKHLQTRSGILRITDNGPGMTLEQAERAIKAGYSGNNPYDSLGLFGMGFNISTGKLGNRTILATARKGASTYIRTEINLEAINKTKSYSLPVEEVARTDTDEYFQKADQSGTMIEVSDWWPEGNSNFHFIDELVKHGMPKIREEIGRRYATILKSKSVRIEINGEVCQPFYHCHWGENRFVERKGSQIPAYMSVSQVVGNVRKCAKCTAVIPDGETECPVCKSKEIRTIEQKIYGWLGIQRFDHETNFGIDLIRNGRAIRISEKSAFFSFVDDFKKEIKDYPIDQQYGRIIGEIHLNFVPVDFMKQDFIRSSIEWQKAMEFLRGTTSLQPQYANGVENVSPIYKLYQGYRRVRNFGPHDLYMGFWDESSDKAARISRSTEEEYYEKFLKQEPGYFDDAEWYKLVEGAVQKPAPQLKECPGCGMQISPDAETCPGCDAVLIGKTCVNPECAQLIPKSAESCPHCGKSQIVKVLEPWFCEVCGAKCPPAETVCVKCGMPKGTKNPLSKEKLLEDSDKVDSLSATKFSIKLADGSTSSPVSFNVYFAHNPMKLPGWSEGLPICTFKNLAEMWVFIDPKHSIFSRCEVTPETVVAEEVAHYIYDFHQNLASRPEHGIAALTWAVMKKQWYDAICLSPQKVKDIVSTVMGEIRDRMIQGMSDLPDYFEQMNNDEKKFMAAALTSSNLKLDVVAGLKASGEYIRFVPDSFILNVFKQSPESFFDAKVFSANVLSEDATNLLGAEVIGDFHKQSIRQIQNDLERVAIFSAAQSGMLWAKSVDPLALNQVKLAADALNQRLG